MINKVKEAFDAFVKEDERIYREEAVEVDLYGHPFTICTNGADWLQENYFSDGEVVGYFSDENPGAEIDGGDGHDFIVVQDRYIVDFWYRHVMGVEDAPIMLDMAKDQVLINKYYGDPEKWDVDPDKGAVYRACMNNKKE